MLLASVVCVMLALLDVEERLPSADCTYTRSARVRDACVEGCQGSSAGVKYHKSEHEICLNLRHCILHSEEPMLQRLLC